MDEERTRWSRATLAFMLIASALGALPYAAADTRIELAKPVLIKAGEIPRGSTATYVATLEAKKLYHIYLVGNWTEIEFPVTDYDIKVSPPAGLDQRYTERTGLPEYVYNDAARQYYNATASGDYRFEVINDPADSRGADAAVFMIAEHIETNKRYESLVYARTMWGAPNYPSFSVLAYEFTSQASNFTVSVDPHADLDVFEVRVYPVADLEEKGHNLGGVPSPLGPYLLGIHDEFMGGYNKDVDGYRARELTASGRRFGESIELAVDSTAVGGTPLKTYMLVLLAEYTSESAGKSLGFAVKEGGVHPVVSTTEEITTAPQGVPLTINGLVSSQIPLKAIWGEIIPPGATKAVNVTLSQIDGAWTWALPALDSVGDARLKIYAVDALGNRGDYASTIKVTQNTLLTCRISPASLSVGDSALISGEINSANAPVRLVVTKGALKDTLKVSADSKGSYSLKYSVKQWGEYTVQAFFDGDAKTRKAETAQVRFTASPKPTSIIASLEQSTVKKGEPVVLSGKVTPPGYSTPVEVLVNSEGTPRVIQATPRADGTFSLVLSLSPGSYEILAQVKSDNVYSSSSSGIKRAQVVALSLTEEITYQASIALAQPVFVGGAVAAALVAVLVVKRKSIPRVGGLISKAIATRKQGAAPEAASSEGRARFRRKDSES